MAFINLLQAVYPVGSIYLSTVNTSPSSLIGGTWVAITDAALRGSTSIGYIGSDTHVQTVEEMPSHRHVAYGLWDWVCSSGFSSGGYNVNYTGSGGNATTEQSPDRGGGQAMSLVQRSYNCFIWYRTA